MYLRNFDLEGSLLVMIDCVGPTKIFCANKALKRKKVVETKHLRHFSFSFFFLFLYCLIMMVTFGEIVSHLTLTDTISFR